jgi:hypothetical protein
MTRHVTGRPAGAVLPHGRGRGPGGQNGLGLPQGQCPVPGCGQQIDTTRLLCRDDWYRLPKRLRDQVWRTWRSGAGGTSREHRRAVLRAISGCELARQRGLTPVPQRRPRSQVCTRPLARPQPQVLASD